MRLPAVLHLSLRIEFLVEEVTQFIEVFLAKGLVEALLCTVCIIAKCNSAAIVCNQISDILAQFVHQEIHLIWFVAEVLARSVKDGREIDVEVLFRLGGRTLIVIAHEDIAVASDVVGIPLDGVWPNFERTAIYLIFDGQRLLQELIEILILGTLRHIASINVDHFLIVDSTLYTKMIFTVFLVLEEVLASGKFLDVVGHALDKHLQFVKTFIDGVDVAEVVGQCLCRGTIRFGEVLLQNFYRASIRDAACQIYAVATCACEIVGNLAVDGLHDFRHTSHIRVGLQCGVTVHILPVTIIADKTGLVVGYVRVDNLTELCR